MTRASGGCHCGTVRFTVNLPRAPIPALDCTCSICSAAGYVHIIVPHADFVLDQGGDQLTSYRFGTGAAEHLFCKRCGIKSFYQSRSHPDAWSVNARCLDEPADLAIERFDGRDWESARAALDADGDAV